MPNKKTFSTKLSFCQPAENNRFLFFSQSTTTSYVSSSQIHKSVNIMDWALSLGSVSIFFLGWHQPAAAVDLKIQNNNLNRQPVLNVIQQFKTRLFPHFKTEKQSRFAQLPPINSSTKNFNSLDPKTLVNFAPNSDFQTNLTPQLFPLSLAEASKQTLQPLQELDLPQLKPKISSFPVDYHFQSLLHPHKSDGTPRRRETHLIAHQDLTVPAVHGVSRSKTLSKDEPKNPYITKLRADIEKLRDRYHQPVKIAHNTPNKTEAKSLQKPADLKDNIPVTKDFLSIAPIDTSNYLPVLATRNETTSNIIQPELPPLSSSEEYLPTAFNGYNWPATGTLTSGYGWRWGRLHKGIDIAGPIGTPILAAAPGKVIFAGWNSGGYGKLIKIEHPDSSVTLYAHNNKIMVAKGQQIRQGQQIAEMGSTGFSTGPHLHFEIRTNGNLAVNPMAFLK